MIFFLSITFIGQSQIINKNNVEQHNLRFFSQHVLKELEFTKCKKIYFKGETEPTVSYFDRNAKEFRLLKIDSIEAYNLNIVDSLPILKLNTKDIELKCIKTKRKKRNDYELIIYRSMELGVGVFYTKLRVSNGYKGAEILILVDAEKFTYQIHKFIF